MQLLTEETSQSKGRGGQVLSQKRLLYMYCTRAVSYLALYCIVENENFTHKTYIMMGAFSGCAESVRVRVLYVTSMGTRLPKVNHPDLVILLH